MSTDLQQFQIHLEAVKKLYFAHFDMEPFDDDIEAFILQLEGYKHWRVSLFFVMMKRV